MQSEKKSVTTRDGKTSLLPPQVGKTRTMEWKSEGEKRKRGLKNDPPLE
jgi:hypothetical protein